jgi:aryl-alcohol dehydrogenase-like predicted oxidoreductase
VDDDESVRAIHAAIDKGVNFFDVSDVYGAGHGEKVLGLATHDRRDRVVLATKFGAVVDEDNGRVVGRDVSPTHIRKACEDSLRRLRTDYIDLYQLHIPVLPAEEADVVAAVLDELCDEGLVRAYGWSTDSVECAERFAAFPKCTAIEFTLNVLEDAPGLVETCARSDMGSIGRSPLAMGVLSREWVPGSLLPSNDVRGAGYDWIPYFKDGSPDPDMVETVEAVREILTSGGRTLAQGALAWILARGDHVVPVPGFRNADQALENAGAMDHGPLTLAQMAEIESLVRTAA